MACKPGGYAAAVVCAWFVEIRGILLNRLSKVKQNLPLMGIKFKSRLIFREILVILSKLDQTLAVLKAELEGARVEILARSQARQGPISQASAF